MRSSTRKSPASPGADHQLRFQEPSEENHGRTAIAYQSARSFARACGAVGRAEPRRSRRRGHQGRTSRQGRRLARLRPALAERRARARTRRSRRISAPPTAARNRSRSTCPSPKASNWCASSPAKCDVLLENYKVGDLARYGLGYDDLQKINPRLIYCSVTGFGQTGPYRDRPGYDFMVAGHGRADEHHRRARRSARRRAAARRRADRRHHDRHVRDDRDLRGDRPPRGDRQGPASRSSRCSTRRSPSSPTRAMNYLATGEVAGAHRQRASEHRALPDLQHHRRRHHPRLRQRQPVQQVLRSRRLPGAARRIRASRPTPSASRTASKSPRMLNAVFAKRTHARVGGSCSRTPAWPTGRSTTSQQVFEEPQVIARGMKIELAHPTAGKVPLVASPMRFSGTPMEYKLPPPALGQHTDEILREVSA